MWHAQDELARDNEVLHLRKGVLYKSGVYSQKEIADFLGLHYSTVSKILKQGMANSSSKT